MNPPIMQAPNINTQTGTNWRRHSLIWLTEQGRHYAADHIHTCLWEKQETAGWKKDLVTNPLIPGIICRQPSTDTMDSTKDHSPGQTGTILAGFSHWQYEKGSRLRMTARIQKTEIKKILSPFDLCTPAERSRLCITYPLLKEVFAAADRYHLKPGLYGSTALEWTTGYPYRNQNSDLDLYLKPEKDCDLGKFADALIQLEQQSGTRLDAEIEIGGNYGVKLKELFSSSKMVLGKGLYDVKLFDKLLIQ